MNKKLLDKYVELMKAQTQSYDTEVAHSKADGLLCELLKELGYEKVVELYGDVSKWYA